MAVKIDKLQVVVLFSDPDMATFISDKTKGEGKFGKAAYIKRLVAEDMKRNKGGLPDRVTTSDTDDASQKKAAITPVEEKERPTKPLKVTSALGDFGQK